MTPVFDRGNHPPFRQHLIGLNWYASNRWAHLVDREILRYRGWLLCLKSNDPSAITYFTEIFKSYWGKQLGPGTLVVPVPSGHLPPEHRGEGLRSVAQRVAQLTDSTFVPELLYRVTNAPQHDGPHRHSRTEQFDSLGIAQPIPAGMHRIVVLDDIMTSCNTMLGALDRLRVQVGLQGARLPELHGFAFGKTLDSARPDVAGLKGIPESPRGTSLIWHSKGTSPV